MDAHDVRIAVAHQPNWCPRVKTLCKLAVGDVWLVLDDVQYVAREWQNRCRVHPMRRNQPAHWLTIPVRRPGGRDSRISDVRIVSVPKTRDYVMSALRHAYRSSPFWDEVEGIGEAVLGAANESLLDTAVLSSSIVLRRAGSAVRVRLASELTPRTSASERLATTCVRSGATHYIAGPGSRAYMRTQEFDRHRITVLWQDWESDIAAAQLDPKAMADWSGLDFVARFGVAGLGELLSSLHRSYRARLLPAGDSAGGAAPLR